MSKKKSDIIFITFAVLAFLTMLYHIYGIFNPTEVTPAWRHALFAVVNIVAMIGVIKRPDWFIWFIGILTLQQWYSHGGYAYMLWQNEHKIDWISIAVIIFLPLLLILLLTEKNLKQAKK